MKKARHCSLCGSTAHDRRAHRNPGAARRLARRVEAGDKREWEKRFGPAVQARKRASSNGYYADRHARRHKR